METVTDRTSNPFGLRPPFDRSDEEAQVAAFGYGDANADFHVIGDHPAIHGGVTTGVPFTESVAGAAIQDVLRHVGFVGGPRRRPTLENCYWSYVHMCTPPRGRSPTDAEYAELEPYFDAELRAITAHVLLPVGDHATDHVLSEFTTQRNRLSIDLATLHARELRGRGFMVVPVREPAAWEDGDREALCSRLESILDSDYRQTKGVATMVG